MKYQYNQQMPHFTSYRRQRGSGIGALVAGVGRFAIPFGRNVAVTFIRKVALPAAKRLGREFVREGLPELVDVISKRKTPKQALRQTVKKTIRKQVGKGRRRRSDKVRRKSVSLKLKPSKRSRSDFFSRVRNYDQ